jgi:hypothetical protein
MTDTLIEQLLVDRPAFHAWPDGTPANWSVAPDALRFLSDLVRPGMNTLETGAGQTTVAFAAGGANHVSVTPDVAQAQKIQAYLESRGVNAAVRFIHESSDEALPSGKGIPERLDIVLIDGAHRFPFPMLDWYYTQARVPVGGMVVVDDYRMPSVRILYDFLDGEEEWELVKAFEVTAFFRRVKETVGVWDWADQRINKPHLDRIAQKTGSSSAPSNLSALFKKWLGGGS